MSISIPILFYLLLVHFLADFVCQTHKQATRKSTSNKYLFYHVFTYSIIWIPAIFVLTSSLVISLLFGGITFILHFITDWITSRLTKHYREKEDFHNFFIIIEADQMLHRAQFIFTYLLLLQYFQ